MFFPKTNVKNDPLRRWHRPDRHFFANGACQVLAFAFLERYLELSFRAPIDQPGGRVHGQPHLREGRASETYRKIILSASGFPFCP
jgi:hypothetical protein